MTTILEIQKPELTYCKEYDVHCYCPKCNYQLQCSNECKNCHGQYQIDPYFPLYQQVKTHGCKPIV